MSAGPQDRSDPAVWASEQEKSLREMRYAVRAAVDAGSIRGVARQVGMSAPGLRNFLDGGTPRCPTWRKLAVWYVNLPRPERGPTGGVHTSLAVLVDHLPSDERARTTRVLLEMLRKVYADAGLEWPE